MAVNTKSVTLDGSTDAISMVSHSDLDPTDAFTVGAWVKTASGSTDMIMQNYNRTTGPVRSGWYLLMLSSGVVRLLISDNVDDGSELHNGAVTIDDDAWHFIVATYSDSANLLSLFIDGVADGTSAATAGIAYGTTNPRIGCLADSGGNSLFWGAGEIDGAFFINGVAWDVNKVNEYMDKDIATSETGLVAYYRMEDTLADVSGSANDHDGTGIGTPSYSTEVPYTGITGIATLIGGGIIGT